MTKGAPQEILELSVNAAEIQPGVEKAVGEFAARGFRSLGVARATKKARWPFLGVLPLSDPPREDSKSTIATAKAMGVQVKMVTGDQVAIGKEIAAQVGLGTNILDAALLSAQASSKQANSRQRSKMRTVSPRSFPSTNTTSSRCCKSTATSSG